MVQGCQRDLELSPAKNKDFGRPDCGMQRLGEVGGRWEKKRPIRATTVRKRSLPLPDGRGLRNYRIPCFSRYSISSTVACCGEVWVASIVNSGFRGGS